MPNSFDILERGAINRLVSKAQNGDTDSFAGLYEYFYEKILRYVTFKLGNFEEAEDITEEVFVRLLRSISSFKHQGPPFSSWLFRIAHNLIVDHFRKNHRRKTVSLEQASISSVTDTQDLDACLDLKFSMKEVSLAMSGLTDLQLEVLTLRFAGGLSIRETAAAVRKKENAVKALQHSGLKKLRQVLVSTSCCKTKELILLENIE